MRIVFMGTPDFAVESLDALHRAGHDIVGVITATDKYGGRGGKQLIQSDVKKYAIHHGLPLLQPPNLKHPGFLDTLRALEADLQVVVAFRMLPTVVWDMPPLGTINVHGSLLPKYRGAAPIHWAVINGESETGVTIFQLKHQIDTGNILAQRSISIGVNETTGEVYNRLKHIGAETLVETVELLKDGRIAGQPQDNTEATPAPKLYKQNTGIDWYAPSLVIHNKIRGLNPFPTAWTYWGTETMKIYQAVYTLDSHDFEPGTILYKHSQEYLTVAAIDGYIHISNLQPSGKRKMTALDFLNGLQNDWPQHFKSHP